MLNNSIKSGASRSETIAKGKCDVTITNNNVSATSICFDNPSDYRHIVQSCFGIDSAVNKSRSIRR
jgi:hypothetical protein